MSEETLQLTKILKWLMVLTGSWRLEMSTNKRIQRSYNIYSIFVQASFLCFFLGLVFNLPGLLKKKDFQLISENVGYTIITLVMLAKLIICQTAKLRKLIAQCILEEKRIYRVETKQIKSNLALHVKQLNQAYFVLISVTIALSSTFSLANYVDYLKHKDLDSTTDKPLPLPIWYPFDSNIYYGTAFIIGTYLTVVGTIYNVVTQALFLTLMTYSVLQLRALKILGETFHLYHQSTDLNSWNTEVEVLKVLRNICIKHQEIISFIDDINLAMKNVLLMEYLLNSINIASVMIRILMMSNPPMMLLFCMILLTHQIFVLFLMSWYANEIEVQSIYLGDALFQSKWYEQSERAKRIISIMIMRSGKPLEIFIGPFFSMSIRTALATVKAAYSLVTMIFTLAED